VIAANAQGVEGVVIRPSPPPAALALMNQIMLLTVIVTVPVEVVEAPLASV